MAIYDIFDPEGEPEDEQLELDLEQEGLSLEEEVYSKKERLFSTIVARLFFFILLIAAGFWALYATAVFTLALAGRLFTWGKVSFFTETMANFWISVKRSLVCSIALFFSLFSPGFGIMVACTYFLMYDKDGIEEVVPASLQNQFKEFFQK